MIQVILKPEKRYSVPVIDLSSIHILKIFPNPHEGAKIRSILGVMMKIFLRKPL
jgi:hypothetical protein